MTGPDQRDGAPDAPKKHRAGTHRLVSPEETLESVRRFFPVMGITRVADITGLDIIGLPVVTVCRPNSRASRCRSARDSTWPPPRRPVSWRASRPSWPNGSLGRSSWAVSTTCDPAIRWSTSISCPGRPTRYITRMRRSCGSRGGSCSPEPRGGFRTRWCTPHTRCPGRPERDVSSPPPTGWRPAIICSRRSAMRSARRWSATRPRCTPCGRRRIRRRAASTRGPWTIPAVVKRSAGSTGPACWSRSGTSPPISGSPPSSAGSPNSVGPRWSRRMTPRAWDAIPTGT